MSCSLASGSPGDAELVALAVAGNKSAFADLVTRHRPMVAALTQRMLRDPDLAEDAVQEAVVTALVSLHRLRNADRFGSWLAGIALNVARRSLRQRPTTPLGDGEVLDERPTPAEIAEAAMVTRRVRDAVAVLPAGQRHATVLFYLEGLTYRETAAELQISVGAVKSRLHQARSALAPRLSGEHEPQEVPPMSDTTTPPTSWIDVSVADVRAGGDDPTHRLHVVILEDDAGRQLPIWIGSAEAVMLAVALEAEETPRPLTYEFAAGLLGAASAQVVEVRLTRLAAGIYYALVAVDGPGGRRELDARPSDALNLALVTDAPIRIAAEVLDDPAVNRRPEWRDYTDSARHIVDEMRKQHQEALEAIEALDEEPPVQ